MSNIFLFTGEEQYLLDQELQRWKEGFVQKFGADSIFTYSPENFDPSHMMQNILGGGLFVSKKMIIIKHIPTDGQQRIPAKAQEEFTESYMKQVANISPDTIVVFVSYKPDKRVKLYKFLQKTAQVKEFSSLTDTQRKQYIKQRSGSVTLDAEVVDHLLLVVGPDLYRLQSELQKLLLWGQAHQLARIDKTDIDKVVFGQVQANTFVLFDVIFKDTNKLLSIIDDMREEGANRNEAIGAMYWGLGLFIMLLDSHKNNVRDNRAITQRISYAPFAVSKHYARIQTLLAHEKGIQQMYL
jgi:DNA polymerase-3 subunit delta